MPYSLVLGILRALQCLIWVIILTFAGLTMTALSCIKAGIMFIAHAAAMRVYIICL